MHERFFEHCLLLSSMVAGATQRLIDTSCFPTQGGQLDTTIEIITVLAVLAGGCFLLLDFLLGIVNVNVNVNVNMAQPQKETSWK